MTRLFPSIVLAAAISASSGLVARSIPSEVEQRWSALRQCGTVDLQQGQRNSATEFYEKALKEAKNFGNRDERYLLSLNDLASLYAADKNWDRARELFAEALKITESKVDKDNPALIKPLNNLVRVSCAAGACYDTVPQLNRLLTIRRKHFPTKSRDIAVTLLLLGEAYEKKGKYAEARKYFSQAVDENAKSPEINNPMTASLRVNVERMDKKLRRQ